MKRHFVMYPLLLPLMLACSLNDVVSVDDPEGFYQNIDRRVVETKEGAIGVYHSSLTAFRSAFSSLSREIAVFTDELYPFQGTPTEGGTDSKNLFELDSRTLEVMDHMGSSELRFDGSLYDEINTARIGLTQARALLRAYGDSSTRALLANTFALEAYTILFLAENGCSGIPLTSVPFDGAINYTQGYSTQELFSTTLDMFDSALTIEHDSLHYKTLAKIGRGRSYLGLGMFDEAFDAVADIDNSWPDYVLNYSELFTPGTDRIQSQFWTYAIDIQGGGVLQLPDVLYVEVHEGSSPGMNWFSAGNSEQDPRVPVLATSTIPARYKQQKFIGGAQTIPLASWIDAKLIEAEASLNNEGLGGAGYLVPLNAARRSIGLSDTTDPGHADARVDLIFRERAYWNYLVGTRLGDLRRLVRVYDRMPITVFPVGDYGRYTQIPFYGNNFVFSPPVAEIRFNDLYYGCDHVNP